MLRLGTSSASRINRATTQRPCSILEQRNKFPEMCNFVDTEISQALSFDANNPCRLVIVHAPVKSGKRCIVEYISTLDSIPNNTTSTSVNLFISSFHRVADELQRKELSSYGLKVYSITSEKAVDKVIADITNFINGGNTVKIHLDEADYGTGGFQKMSLVWNFIRNVDQVKTILYSATIEEAVFSNRALMEGVTRNIVDSFQTTSMKYVKYTPPSTFCGPEKFLEEGLVHDAIPFFNINQTDQTIGLSHQSRSIMTDLREEMNTPGSKRNIVILRLSYMVDIFGNDASRKDKKAIRVFLNNVDLIPELEGCIIVVDKSSSLDFECHSEHVIFETVQWSSSAYWQSKTQSVPVIVIMDQTASRSTEWACHDRVFATHNFSRTIFYNNQSQQDERPNHYSTKYVGGFQKIKIYSNVRSFEYSAGLITVGSYLQGEYKMQLIRNTDKYCIIKIETEYVVEGACNGRRDTCRGGGNCICNIGLAKETVEQIMLELGSHCTPKLSPRVMSDVRDRPNVRKIFVHCQSDDEYNNMITDPSSRINLFIKHGNESWNRNYRPAGNIFTRQTRLDTDGTTYLTRLRGSDSKLYLDQLTNWGFSLSHRKPRLMVCYNRETEELGVCVRTFHGISLITDIETSRSMYTDNN